MYTEIESMKDMLESNLEQKKYTPVLLLSRFTDTYRITKNDSTETDSEPATSWEDSITTREAVRLLRTWREQLLGFLSDEDAGCVINSGNVLVLIKESRADLFMERISRLKLHIRAKGASLETDAMLLTDDLSRLFLDFA